MRPYALVLSCEHGGNKIPSQYKPLFVGATEVLRSHRGYDPGSLALARSLAKSTGAALFESQISRLLVELNRSIGHPRLYSEQTRALDKEARRALLERYYFPYREAVEDACSQRIAHGFLCLHLSVHSFTPVLDGETRNCDVGLLYDPSRAEEARFVRNWQQRLREASPQLVVRLNYPYQGKADGLTTHLRRKFLEQYVGIELEVNQRIPLGPKKPWRELQTLLAATLPWQG